MAIDLLLPPRHTPGEDTSGSSRVRPMVSKPMGVVFGDIAGATTVALFNVPANTLVLEVKVQIATAFDDLETMVIGDGDDADRFLGGDVLDAGKVGFKSSLQGWPQPGSGGHLYSSADTIDLKTTDTPTVGQAYFWLVYIPRADEVALVP